MAKTSVAWKNFFQPTPKNVLYFVEGVKGIIVTVSVTEYVSGDSKSAFYLMLTGAFLDFVAKFISRVEQNQYGGDTEPSEVQETQ